MKTPNYRAALDAATGLCLHIGHQRRGASERGRWAAGPAAKIHQPQRGDLSIARPSRSLRQPRRGDMEPSRTGHAAPTGLAEKSGGAVTINMSLLRSWPNPAHALDGGIPARLIAGHHWPAASDEHRSAV